MMFFIKRLNRRGPNSYMNMLLIDLFSKFLSAHMAQNCLSHACKTYLKSSLKLWKYSSLQLELFFTFHLFYENSNFQAQAFLDFRGFDFRNFLFNAVYNSILFFSPLVLLCNLDLCGFCFCIFLCVCVPTLIS